MILIIAMIKFIKFSWYPHLLHLMLRIRGRKWNKALILDLLLYNMFISRRHKGEIGFNYLFLNAFAHVQHHYLLNSPYVKSSSKNPSWYLANENDPVRDAVITYDRIIHDFILRTRSEQVLVGTGLTQIPYDKAKFYYRLKDHENFLVSMKLNYVKVRKGMTRDFYVDFACNKDRDAAMEELQNISLNEKKFFGDFSVNNCTLFCSLVYPSEILVNDTVRLADKDFKVLDLVNFVAIKNGMHHDRGFLFLNIEHAFPEKRVPLERVHYLVKSLGNKHIS